MVLDKGMGLSLRSETTQGTAQTTDTNLEEEGVKNNVNFSCENVGRVFKKVGFLMSNLSLVYFLEYTITTSFTIANAQ